MRSRWASAAAAGVLVAVVGLVGCSNTEGPTEVVTAAPPSAKTDPTPTRIPDLDDPAAAECINRYPERLAEYPIAFAGTLVGQEPASQVRRAQARSDPGAEPFDWVFKVDRAYAGDLVPPCAWRFGRSTAVPMVGRTTTSASAS